MMVHKARWQIKEVTHVSRRWVFLGYASFLVAVLATLAVFFVTRSRVGLALKAIREDEVSAVSHGINVLKYKIIAFAGGAAMAGVAGSIYGYYLLQATPINVLTFNWLFLPILMTVLGGTGTLLGPWLGAIVIYLISWYGGSYFAGWDAVISGVVIVLVMIFIPSGIMGIAQKVPGLGRKGTLGPYPTATDPSAGVSLSCAAPLGGRRSVRDDR